MKLIKNLISSIKWKKEKKAREMPRRGKKKKPARQKTGKTFKGKAKKLQEYGKTLLKKNLKEKAVKKGKRKIKAVTKIKKVTEKKVKKKTAKTAAAKKEKPEKAEKAEKTEKVTSPEIERLEQEKEETARRYYVEQPLLSEAEKNYLMTKIKSLERQIEEERKARIAIQSAKTTGKIVRVAAEPRVVERLVRVSGVKEPERVRRVYEEPLIEDFRVKSKKEKIKSIMKEIRKQEIVTEYDRIYKFIQKAGKAKLKEIVNNLKIDKKRVLEHIEALEEEGLVKIKYPPIGDPIISIKK